MTYNKPPTPRRVSMTIFTGAINKDLRVTFGYTYTSDNGEGKYPTVRMSDRGTIIINHSYSLTLNTDYSTQGLFIVGKDWERFCVLLEKTIKLISESLYELYPEIDSTEFTVDSRTLDRFKVEKACTSGGMSMYPDIWVSKDGQTYPAIQINTSIGSCTTMKLPLEDAIPLSRALNKIDPNLYGLNIIEAMESMR